MRLLVKNGQWLVMIFGSRWPEWQQQLPGDWVRLTLEAGEIGRNHLNA